MRPKFKVGDVVIRKKLPQYEGYGQPILTIEKVDAERGYYFCGYDKYGYGIIFDIERQDDFMLYRLNLIKRMKCWFNNIKLIKK